MNSKTLLLSASYEPICFISEKRMFKYLFKDKVEIVSIWDETVKWINGEEINYPAVVKLTNLFYNKAKNVSFTRRALVKRDNSSCCYCGKKLTPSKITIDHIIPTSKGGANSFLNCVVSCQPCNGRKANRTLDEVGMFLLNKPYHPSFAQNLTAPSNCWHEDWGNFI